MIGKSYRVSEDALQATDGARVANAPICCTAQSVGVDLTPSSWHNLAVRPKSDKEILPMAIQSHLAELERRHQALEDEIAEALQHPSSDDLQIAELKRRKLLVKDEIVRVRHDSLASVH
jgi:hypothetical protein